MNFDKLSQMWQQHNINNQFATVEEVLENAKLKTRKIKKQQHITIAILSIVSIILLSFYFWLSGYKSFMESLGLFVMILVLVIRIGLELLSKRYLREIDSTLNFHKYVKQHKIYLKNRRWLHFVFSPLIYILYFGGFVSLLDIFKENVSAGLYLYILISGVIVFIVLALFIMIQIRREHRELTFINSVLNSKL